MKPLRQNYFPMNTKMKAIGFLLANFCAMQTLLAQQGVISAGGDISSAQGTIAYTIGQVSYTYLWNETGSVNQGLQQPVVFNLVGMEDLHEDIFIRLFPNPSNAILHVALNISAKEEVHGGFSAQLYDLNGKLLLQQQLPDDINTIAIDRLTEAMYLLQVWKGDTFIKSFALTKSN